MTLDVVLSEPALADFLDINDFHSCNVFYVAEVRTVFGLARRYRYGVRVRALKHQSFRLRTVIVDQDLMLYCV